jgi:hypothetical protein
MDIDVVEQRCQPIRLATISRTINCGGDRERERDEYMEILVKEEILRTDHDLDCVECRGVYEKRSADLHKLRFALE